MASFEELVRRGLETGNWDVSDVLSAPVLPPQPYEQVMASSPEKIADPDHRQAYLLALTGTYAVGGSTHID